MSSDFTFTSIGSACEISTGFPFKSNDYCGKSESIKLLRGDNIAQGTLRWDGVKRWNPEELEPSVESKYSLRSGDVVVAMDRPWIEAGLKFAAIQESDLPCLLVQRVACLRAGESIDQGFLKYVVSDYAFTTHVLAVQTGTAVPHISSKQIAEYEFAAPPLQEQKAIAHILGTLDDKIELNRKTNETLEAMAKALFKSWFVDFDPVRAKAEGRPTGLPAEVSDLFPDSFEDSELGEIPSGWGVFELGDCSLHIESGTRPKGGIDKNLAFGIPSIGAESISPIGQFDFSKTKWVDAAFAQSAGRGWIQNYDVALYKDGGKPGEFRPRTALYGDGFPFDKAMVNEHVFLLRSSQLGQPYLYYLFNFDLVLAQIIHKGSSKGAQPGLNQDEVRTSSFVKPDKRVLNVFNLTVEPSIRKQLLLGKDCQVLSQLRDALLPKLISGEIRIPDAEKMLEEVGV
jgi:type I restriction enzyme S subunit